MKTRNIITLSALAAMVTLSSCRHKDIEFEVNDRGQVYVAFDWQKAPEAKPTSMLVYFYPADGDKPLLYTFADISGGPISIPYDSYIGLGINGDNTDWAGIRNTNDPDSFEVYTRDAESLEAYGILSRSVPRAVGAENERMAKTPGMMWSDRLDNIVVDGLTDTDANGVQVITFYPDEVTCHYTVDILDIEHSEYLSGAEVDGTLSGMAEGYLHGRRTATDVPVTMPFTLKSNIEEKSLHSEFLTFGECGKTARKHMLTVYVYLTDGTKWYHTYDVSDQVSMAPDPRNVHIVLRGLDLPEPIGGGSGFRPEVGDWNEIHINLPM